MKPNNEQIIDSIIWSLKTYVAPEVRSPFGSSVLMTVENLLRHVKLRVGSEAQIVAEDNTDLEEVLRTVLDRLGDDSELANASANAAAAVREALDAGSRAEPDKATLEQLNARSLALREALDSLLHALSSVRARFRDAPAYRDCRQAIRNYLARQLEREDALITPAFTGGRR